MKILLICSAGMSTSLLVTKMEQAAQRQNLTVEIKAVSDAEGKQVLPDYDIVLLGPQVRFLKSELARITDKPVEVIDMMAYGRMDGERVLNDALAKFKV